jgi:CheY-like chemotaxis protein
MDRTKYILLADDNDNDVKLITMALARSRPQPEVAVTHDGAEALDYLYCRETFSARTRRNPDVILLDLKMPLVDGLEVLRQIKNDLRLKTIPVVMLTSSCEETDVLKSYQLGVNAYVVKPVDFKEFLEAIKDTEVFWAARNEAPPDRDNGGDERTCHAGQSQEAHKSA